MAFASVTNDPATIGSYLEMMALNGEDELHIAEMAIYTCGVFTNRNQLLVCLASNTWMIIPIFKWITTMVIVSPGFW